jgi:hypothetical protein
MVSAKVIEEYSEQATLACERVLATIVRCIGAPWRGRLCVVGGLAPRYLVPDAAESALIGHIGTTDVDMALSLAVRGADAAAYRTLEKNLKRAGLERLDGASWRWTADVDGLPVVVELLGDDGRTEGGALFTPKVKPPAGVGGLTLLCIRGVELANADAITVTRGVRLIDGALAVVEFRVANVAPFVALKADAYLDRREPKDVYDLLYVARRWDGGPGAAGEAIARSPVASDPFVRSCLTRLALEFESVDHAGPRDYAAFIARGDRGVAYAGARDDAILIWRQLHTTLREHGIIAPLGISST